MEKYYIEFIYNKPNGGTVRENLPEVYDSYEAAQEALRNPKMQYETKSCFLIHRLVEVKGPKKIK